MASVAFDLQNLSRRLDTLDAKGPVDRNIQSASALALTITSLLQQLQEGGAGAFELSEAWTDATRTPYEAAVVAAQVGCTALVTKLKVLAKY